MQNESGKNPYETHEVEEGLFAQQQSGEDNVDDQSHIPHVEKRVSDVVHHVMVEDCLQGKYELISDCCEGKECSDPNDVLEEQREVRDDGYDTEGSHVFAQGVVGDQSNHRVNHALEQIASFQNLLQRVCLGISGEDNVFEKRNDVFVDQEAVPHRRPQQFARIKGIVGVQVLSLQLNVERWVDEEEKGYQ